MNKLVILIGLTLVLSSQCLEQETENSLAFKLPENEKSHSFFLMPILRDAKMDASSIKSKKKTGKSFSKSQAYGMWVRYGKRAEPNNNDDYLLNDD